MNLQAFSRHISFSRTFQESPYSSTFQAFANTGAIKKDIKRIDLRLSTLNSFGLSPNWR